MPFTRTDPSRTVVVDTLGPAAAQAEQTCEITPHLRVKLTVIDARGVSLRTHRFSCDATDAEARCSEKVGSITDIAKQDCVGYAVMDFAGMWQPLMSNDDWQACATSTRREEVMRVRATVSV